MQKLYYAPLPASIEPSGDGEDRHPDLQRRAAVVRAVGVRPTPLPRVGGDRSALERRSPLWRPSRPGAEVGADRPRGGDPDPDRVLLRSPDRPVDGRVRSQWGCSGSPFATTGTSRATSSAPGRWSSGRLITSAIALAIGVPVAVATAVYLTELCPRRARAAAVAILVELLAAVPSVVYGLWGVFVLIPKLSPPSSGSRTPSASCRSSAARSRGRNYFIAGLILAIMILPIVSGDLARGDARRCHRSQGGRARRSGRRAGR